MKKVYLDFEKSIEELEDKIEGLRFQDDSSAVDISDEILILKKKAEKLIRDLSLIHI